MDDLNPIYNFLSSHNWNSLFLGANAVADVMAERYNTSKSSILDAVSKWELKTSYGFNFGFYMLAALDNA